MQKEGRERKEKNSRAKGAKAQRKEEEKGKKFWTGFTE
jgi:hypothetical protein